MIIKPGVSRRRLLEMSSSAMLLYPLTEILKLSEAKAATLTPRALFITWSCGSYGNVYWPAGDTGPLGALPTVTAPLEAHKNDLIILKGLVQRGDTNHRGGSYQVLAGWGKGGEIGMPGRETSTEVPYSLDQMLADKWGNNTPIKSVHLGAATQLPTKIPFVSFNSKGTGVPATDNPKASYDKLFGSFNLTSGGSGALKLANDNVLAGRKRLVDYLKGDIKKIGSALGDMERKMFEAHVTTLDDLSKEIAKQESLGNPGMPTPGGGSGNESPRLAQCNPKEIAGKIPTDNTAWYTQPSSLQNVFSLNRQIMVQALACGLTRVGVLTFSQSDIELDYGTGNYHLASHGGGPAFASVQAGFMKVVAELASNLKAVKLNDHSLFDETLILGATDVGDDPNSHDTVNIANFLLGNLGGKIKGGRMISFPFEPRNWSSLTNGMDYNRLLITYAALVGEPGLNVIGNTAFKGTIAELMK